MTTPPQTKPLTERGTRFVAAFVACGNATEAAVTAGFSKKAARQQGARMMANAAICAAIEAARGPVLETAQMTLEGHLQELADIRDAAKHAGQYGPANAAEANRGKVAGFYVDKSAIDVTSGGKPLPADERSGRLEAMLATIAARGASRKAKR